MWSNKLLFILLVLSSFSAPALSVRKMNSGKTAKIDCKNFKCNIRDFDAKGNPGEWQAAQSFSGGRCEIEIRTYPSNQRENLCIIRWTDVVSASVTASISLTGPTLGASLAVSSGERAFEGNCQAWCGSKIPNRGSAKGTNYNGDDLVTYHSCYGFSENNADPNSDEPFCYVSNKRYDTCGARTALCGTSGSGSNDDFCPSLFNTVLFC